MSGAAAHGPESPAVYLIPCGFSVGGFMCGFCKVEATSQPSPVITVPPITGTQARWRLWLRLELPAVTAPAVDWKCKALALTEKEVV